MLFFWCWFVGQIWPGVQTLTDLFHACFHQVRRDSWWERLRRGLRLSATPETSSRLRRSGFATSWEKAICTSTPAICSASITRTLSTSKTESATPSGEFSPFFFSFIVDSEVVWHWLWFLWLFSLQMERRERCHVRGWRHSHDGSLCFGSKRLRCQGRRWNTRARAKKNLQLCCVLCLY